MRFAKFAVVLGGLLWLVTGLTTATAEPSLPLCQSFDEYRKLLVSPDFGNDRTLFSTAIFNLNKPEITRWALLRSVDAGLTWTELSLKLSSRGVPFAYTSQNYLTDHTLYVLGYGSATGAQVVWRSTDVGDTWAIHVRNLPPGDAFLQLTPLDADTLFAWRGGGGGLSTPEDGLFRTTDAGVTWTQLYSGWVYYAAVSPQFANDRTLLISPGDYKASYGVKKSTDEGQTWTPHNEGLVYHNPGKQITWIQFAPGFEANQTVFLNLGGVLFKSTDAGDTWQDITWGVGLPFEVREQVISPRYDADQTLWIWVWGSSKDGTYISRDGGVSWVLLPAPKTLAVQGAAEYYGPSGRFGVMLIARHISLSDPHPRLYKSYDYGQTWQCLEDPTPPVHPAPVEIPEPATWVLLGSAMAALAGYARRRKPRR